MKNGRGNYLYRYFSLSLPVQNKCNQIHLETLKFEYLFYKFLLSTHELVPPKV